MPEYTIKQKIISEPEIELPEGSQVVSVKHHDAFGIIDSDIKFPESWQVIWLEPK